FIEQRIECFEHERLVLLRCGTGHVCVPRFPVFQLQSFEPPSTRMVSPVIQRASCEARNATTEPTSSGWPIRLRACMPRTKDLPSSVLTRFDMSVSIAPGATALT